MADSSNQPTEEEISLPDSVQKLIDKICREQNLPPPGPVALQKLASLSEADAMQILHQISEKKIQTLSGFIIYMVRNHFNNGNGSVSPQKRPCLSLSPLSPPSHSVQNLTRITPVRRMFLSPPPPGHDGGGSSSFPSTSSSLSASRSSIPQYVALGELEFRKAFLILSYIGSKRLEDVATADQIRALKDLPMIRFESEVWKAFGENYINREDRRRTVDWDSGKTYMYHCHVSPLGSCTFKGPYLVNHAKTHLQRVVGDDNVMMVKFAEEVLGRKSLGINSEYAKYSSIAREGIQVGLRLYRFFVFKDGGKEEKKKNPTRSSVKCYFVRTESDACIDMGQHYLFSGKSIHEAREMFMHAHTVTNVANYMSRFSLILSKTKKLGIDLANVEVQRIDDMLCCDSDGNIVYREGKPLIHTDGTGFVSEDIALRCPNHVFKGECSSNEKFEKALDGICSDLNLPESRSQEPPLLMQVRLFNKGYAVKGTLLVNKMLPFQTIQVRPSMIKVETDPNLLGCETFNSLEVVKTSTKPKRTFLSKNLIALLSYGGVPDNFFEGLLKNALEDAQGAFTNRRSALKVSLNYSLDDFLVTRMLLSGIPLDESYLHYSLSDILNKEKKNLLGGRLPLPESYYLMGTVDPTGTLQSDEVCIVLNDGQVSWEKVLVYRNPGLHFGDIHVLKAIYVKDLEDIIGNSKYAIFFPCSGPRSLADEIAKGDFDGDMYFVSRNAELLKHYKESERWFPNSIKTNVPIKRPSDFKPDELEDELFKLFLTTRFNPSYAAGVAADSWLAIMDRLLTLGDESSDEKNLIKKNLLQLIDLYYDALDAPKKSGRQIEVPPQLKAKKYPNYMEKNGSNSYISDSILGRLYKTVKDYDGVEDASGQKIWKLPCFEDEVPEACMNKWKELHIEYRKEMSAALTNNKEKEDKDEAADEVMRKYKQILYGAQEFEQSTRSLEDIYNESLAIYHLTYNYAQGMENVKSCGFAWKVAGPALYKIYANKQSERILVCTPSALKEICG